MSYYTVKRQFVNKIENLIRKNSGDVTRETFYYDASHNYGFGQKIVNDFIDLLLKMGKISEFGGVLSWNHQKNSKKES